MFQHLLADGQLLICFSDAVSASIKYLCFKQRKNSLRTSLFVAILKKSKMTFKQYWKWYTKILIGLICLFLNYDM